MKHLNEYKYFVNEYYNKGKFSYHVNWCNTYNLSLKSALKIYEEKCEQLSYNDTPIYRAFFNDDFYNYVKLTGVEREDEKKVLHDYLINNSIYWKDFPKRRLCCSTEGFPHKGNRIFRVIPFKNVLIGTVPADDLQADLFTIEQKNILFGENFEEVYGSNATLWGLHLFFVDECYSNFETFKSYYKNEKGIDIEEFLKPSNFKINEGFKYMNYDKFKKWKPKKSTIEPFHNPYTTEYSREVWFDTNALLIDDEMFENSFSNHIF